MKPCIVFDHNGVPLIVVQAHQDIEYTLRHAGAVVHFQLPWPVEMVGSRQKIGEVFPEFQYATVDRLSFQAVMVVPIRDKAPALGIIPINAKTEGWLRGAIADTPRGTLEEFKRMMAGGFA